MKWVAGLGAAQLIAWGTLYYPIAVLGEPMGAELDLTRRSRVRRLYVATTRGSAARPAPP